MGEVTKLCFEKGFLIQPELAQKFENLYQNNPELTKEILNFFFASGNKLITHNAFLNNGEKLMLLLNNLKELRKEGKQDIESYSLQVAETFQIKSLFKAD